MARNRTGGGHAKLIGFDMGGTSTDVSHFAGSRTRLSTRKWAECGFERP